MWLYSVGRGIVLLVLGGGGALVGVYVDSFGDPFVVASFLECLFSCVCIF